MRLTDCFMEIFAYVGYFLSTGASKQFTFNQVKADILRLVSESEEKFNKGSIPREDYDLARFAVCAWVDETIMGSSWEEKGNWLKEPLQRLYFQTSDAGAIFFDRLNTLGPHQRDVREVYYLCLAMGFTGRFCNDGDDYLLEQLKISNLKLLTGSSMGIPSLEKEELFPEAYPVITDQGIPLQSFESGFSKFTMISAGAPLGLFLVLFLIYGFVLSNIGENILSAVP